MSKIQRNGTLKNNLYMLGMVWKIQPKRIIFVLLKEIINYGLWVFSSVIFIRYIFGSADSVRGFNETAAFVVFSLILTGVCNGFVTWLETRFIPKSDTLLYKRLNETLFEKAAAVDISCYENPDFYDSYTKAVTEASTRAISVMESISAFIASVFSSVYVTYAMFSIHKISVLFVIMPVVSSLVLGRMQNKNTYARKMENIPHDRAQDYINRVMYLQKYAKEIRLSRIKEVLFARHTDAMEKKLATIRKYAPRILIVGWFKQILSTTLPFESLWMYAAYCALVARSIGLGDFVVLSNAIVSATWMLIFMSQNIVSILENGLYIQNLKVFLECPVTTALNGSGKIPGGTVESLEFKNVGFRYEGADTDSLKGVSFVVRKGEKIALVGENGAGKTTLVKLIMRLYEPTEGQILYNGLDIREYNLEAYRKIIGTVFQDYNMLSMTVLENVVMGEITGQAQKDGAVRALADSGAHEAVSKLPLGFDTILTREFDDNGAVMSGGEFQKIAVARAFAKNSQIMILDEPSSALDPIAEYKMYETIASLCGRPENRDMIAIFISHRLSSTIMADHIFVMENGRVIESGSHANLITKKGSYWDMYRMQAKSYLKEGELL